MSYRLLALYPSLPHTEQSDSTTHPFLPLYCWPTEFIKGISLFSQQGDRQKKLECKLLKGPCDLSRRQFFFFFMAQLAFTFLPNFSLLQNLRCGQRRLHLQRRAVLRAQTHGRQQLEGQPAAAGSLRGGTDSIKVARHLAFQHSNTPTSVWDICRSSTRPLSMQTRTETAKCLLKSFARLVSNNFSHRVTLLRRSTSFSSPSCLPLPRWWEHPMSMKEWCLQM